MAKRRGPRGPYRLLTPTERAEIEARFRAGARVREVMARFGVPHTSAGRIQAETALTRPRVVCSAHRLSFEERERIFVGVCRGESDSEIARALGRHRSTVGREIRRCSERRQYRPLQAERVARRLARRPKATKLSSCPQLVTAVQDGLERRWSPQQISARLKVDHPDDEGMRISHETIYRSLYVQSRGELRRQLTANLRTGRSTRRSSGRIHAQQHSRRDATVSRHFGSWTAGLQAAGLDPTVWPRSATAHWDAPEVIRALQNATRAQGLAPTCLEWLACHKRPPCASTVRNRFGTWKAAQTRRQMSHYGTEGQGFEALLAPRNGPQVAHI